ncbi:MAG: deoxyribodipyrimidine photo-lyase [Tunicatimonas sp.]
MASLPVHIVWFKRDLRVHDHQPLHQAAPQGPVLPLYVVEPSVVTADDYGTRHWEFVAGSLRELTSNLTKLGQPLIVRIGEVVEVLTDLRDQLEEVVLWAHEETGNQITYQRDEAVRRWAKQHAVPFHELPQNGVIRALRDRDGWAKRWEQRMTAPTVDAPTTLTPVPGITSDEVPTAEMLGLPALQGTVQRPGEAAAHETLRSFLHERGEVYHRALSSPVSAYDHCSRLSPHLAWGTISLRTVVQALRQRRAELADNKSPEVADWKKSFRAFEARLHWQSHFVQKLEQEPRIEAESFIPAYDALRADAFNEDHYAAWCAGRTGFPMVDACVRALCHTGYLNFRMRAMLVSFASYDLWLDWRRYGHFLAREWTDYEPGIHYSQLQMQSGTTGINTLRIYNPTKQGKDHDPEGVFIRQWVPELAQVPLKYLHEPNKMPPEVQREADCVIGKDYPEPLVDHVVAARAARTKIYELRRQPELRQQAEAVMERHGSRKRPSARRPKKSKPRSSTPSS